MAATVALNEYNGAGETLTADVARADFLSADVASTSTTVRNNNPLTKVAATTVRSYEKYHRLNVTGGTWVSIDTIRHYFDATLPTGFSAETSAHATPDTEVYAQPSNGDSTVATTPFPTSDPGVQTIEGSLTSGGTEISNYAISQLDMVSDTAGGGFNINVVWKWAETT